MKHLTHFQPPVTFPLRFTYSQHPVLIHPCSFRMGDQISCPYKTTGEIIVLYILIVQFLDTSHKGRVKKSVQSAVLSDVP